MSYVYNTGEVPVPVLGPRLVLDHRSGWDQVGAPLFLLQARERLKGSNLQCYGRKGFSHPFEGPIRFVFCTSAVVDRSPRGSGKGSLKASSRDRGE